MKHLKITATRAERGLDHTSLAGLAQRFIPAPQLRLQPCHLQGLGSNKTWQTLSLREAGGAAEAHTAQKELMQLQHISVPSFWPKSACAVW